MGGDSSLQTAWRQATRRGWPPSPVGQPRALAGGARQCHPEQLHLHLALAAPCLLTRGRPRRPGSRRRLQLLPPFSSKLRDPPVGHLLAAPCLLTHGRLPQPFAMAAPPRIPSLPAIPSAAPRPRSSLSSMVRRGSSPPRSCTPPHGSSSPSPPPPFPSLQRVLTPAVPPHRGSSIAQGARASSVAPPLRRRRRRELAKKQ